MSVFTEAALNLECIVTYVEDPQGIEEYLTELEFTTHIEGEDIEETWIFLREVSSDEIEVVKSFFVYEVLNARLPPRDEEDSRNNLLPDFSIIPQGSLK